MRLEISRKEVVELDRDNIKWTELSDFYITRIIRKANELGLQGKKIKKIVGITDIDGIDSRYIDFICEGSL